MKHNWKFLGCIPHNGEYWYKCENCGASDWIAGYGTLDQLLPEECVPPPKPVKVKFFAYLGISSIVPLPGCETYQQAFDKANELCPSGFGEIWDLQDMKLLQETIAKLGLDNH